MPIPANSTRRNGGFTLIEIVAALGILSVALFMLLQTQFASLNLIVDVEDRALIDVFITQAVGIAEFEILSGEESGEGDFGKNFEGYSYSYTAELRDTEEAPGLFDVSVSVVSPEETHIIAFLVYDGQQIDLK